MKQILTTIILALILCIGQAGQAGAGARILFLGDSLTAGLGVEQAQAWPALIESRLKQQGIDGITVINGSISGSTTASAVSRLTWYLRLKPDILVLALGANDGLRGLSLEAMKDNLDAAIRLARANGMTVILAGMEVPPNYGETFSRKFRAVFADLARSHGLLFIPFLLKGVGGHPGLNQADGLHPNPEGHRIIADTVLPVIMEAL